MKNWKQFIPSGRVLIGTIVGAVILIAIFTLLSVHGESGDAVASAKQQDQNSTSIFFQSIALLVFGSALTFIGTLFWWQKNQAVSKATSLARDHALLMDRVRAAEIQLAKMGETIVPISTAFQAILIKELTHFHTPEMDSLMQKIGPPNTLTPSEEKRLFNVLLPEREKDMGPQISDSERDAARILPAVTRRAKAESDALQFAQERNLKLISIASIIGVPVIASEKNDSEKIGT
jgi:hypothetical protein